MEPEDQGTVNFRKYCAKQRAIEQACQTAESPIEADFWHQMRKTRDTPWETLAGQVKLGRYRVDCLFEFASERLVVELDGKAFHNETDDLHRDKDLLACHGVTTVVHIPGSAIYMMPNATMQALAAWWPVFRITRELGVIRASELRDEIRLATNRDGLMMSTSEWLKECGAFYHVWDVGDTSGFVARPAAVLYSWNVRRITRRSRP